MNNVITNSDITIIKPASLNYLWNVSGDHHFNFKINTSEKIDLPIYGQLLDHKGFNASIISPLDLFSIQPGNYTDDFVYTLTF